MESAMFSDMVHLKKLELLYFLPEMTLFNLRSVASLFILTLFRRCAAWL